MYQKVLNFIKYNNAFTILFVICFLSFGVSFAASPDVRSSVYSSKETIVSVDNSMIISTDLDNFNFNLRISSITDDEKSYYAVYSYQTLTIENGAWQNKTIEKILTVNKKALDGKDLGLYVAKELGDNMNYELSYLQRVQQLEKQKGESQKVVTVEYSGLVGKLLNPKEKVIEGYSPVIPEPAPEVIATVESQPQSVIVSVQHPESVSTSTHAQSQTEIAPEATSTATPTTTATATQKTPSEEIVDGDLVKQVVQQELTANESTTTPPLDSATSTKDTVSEPAQ